MKAIIIAFSFDFILSKMLEQNNIENDFFFTFLAI